MNYRSNGARPHWQPNAAGLAEQIAEELFRTIVSGGIEPGARLSEVNLAKRFGVSRTPVREALRKLAGQGVVELTRGAGAIVPELDSTQVREQYELRMALFGLAAYLAAERATSGDIKRLSAQIDVLRGLVECGDAEQFYWGQREFYNRVVIASRNAALARAVQTHGQLSSRARLLSLARPGRMAEALAADEAAVQAISDRRGADAEASLRTMMQHAVEALVDESSSHMQLQDHQVKLS